MQTQFVIDDNTEMDWGLPVTQLVLQSQGGRILTPSSLLAASGFN